MSKKSLFLLGSYAPSLINFRGDLISQLVKEGWEVHVAAPNIDFEIGEKLDELGCSHYSVPLERTGLSPIRDIRFLYSVYKLLRVIRPSVFLGYTIKPVVFGLLAAKMARVPRRCVIITGLGSAFTADVYGKNARAMRVARGLYRIALRYCHMTMFQNPDDRDLFEELRLVQPSFTSLVNGSGVDVQHFAYTQLPTELRFLCIARLIVEKGVREYVAAARIVQQQFPIATFELAGWIDEHPFAIPECEVRGWCEDGIISFVGKLEDVRPALGKARIYVLPSYREGTPRTVLEALATGRPIITTDAPGCRETVEHGKNGLLVAPKSTKELADAMMYLARNPELTAKMAMVSRSLAENKYDVRLVNEQIIANLRSELGVRN